MNGAGRWMLACATLASASLTACGGGASHSVVPLARATNAPQSSTPGATTFAYGSDALRGATYVGPATNSVMGVDVVLSAQNASGLGTYARAVSDPHSGSYRHFLTPQQIGARYGASAAAIATAAKYFASYHLHVGTWPQHLALFVAGPQTALERAFGTTFGIFQSNGATFVAPTTTPKFAQSLPVVAVQRIVTVQRAFRTITPIGGPGVTGSGFTPQQIRNAFDFTGAYDAGYTGAGITVGIVGTGPISPADVPTYGTTFGTNVATVTQTNVTDQGVATTGLEGPAPDQGFQSPPPATAPCQGFLPGCNPEDIEAQLDTESVAGLAPGAHVAFYLAYDPAYCADNSGNISAGPCAPNLQPLEGIALADDEIQQIISDNVADVVSLSYGGPEQANADLEFSSTDPAQGLGPEEFAALAAEGVAVFVSSGDTGAEGCQRPVYLPALDEPCVSYPSTDPNVTSVGAVNAPLDRFGNLTNQITGWGYATAQGNGGSGGGVSQYFAQPSWQAGLPGIVGSKRNQPDVSLLGDPLTGAAVVYDSGIGGPGVGSIGGTSLAAPQMAALWALVLQACASSATCATASGSKPYRLGNAAPYFYKLYATAAGIAPTYAQTFDDVLYGDNQQSAAQPTPSSPPVDAGFTAGPGYDLVTGIGVPFARALIKGVTAQ